MTIAASEQDQEVGFPEMASRTLSDIRSAITQMFAEVSGGIRKSYDVHKFLGVDARLSWQIFKLTGPGDAIALAPHVPAPATMRRLLAAAAKHGISAERIENVRRAFKAFEDLVEQHAGDRSIFETMTRSLGDDEASQQTDLAYRKGIFKGHRHYMALEVETQVNTVIHHGLSDAGLVDVGYLRGKLGMRRLRSEAELLIDNPKLWNIGDAGRAFKYFDVKSPGGGDSGLISEFSTHPLPELKTRLRDDGQPMTLLSGDMVGRQGRVDLVFGNVWRGVQLISPDENNVPGLRFHFYMTTPLTNMFVDVLVPRTVAANLRPSLEIYGMVPAHADIAEVRRTHSRFAFNENIVRLSGGMAGAQMREFPQYIESVKWFCSRLDWRVDDLEVFRLYIKYPIVGSLVSLRFDAL